MQFKQPVIAASALLLLGLASCKPTAPTTYTINGTFPDSMDMNGKMVYMYSGRTAIDSTTVANNIFTFTGTPVDSIGVVTLLVPETYRTPVFLEAGQIAVNMADPAASGTPLNDDYGKYMQAENTLNEEWNAVYEPLKKDTVTAPEVLSAKIDSAWAVFEPKFNKVVEDVFNAHTNDALGAMMFRNLLMQEGLTAEKFAEYKGKAGEKVLKSDAVAKEIGRTENLMATQAGAAFRDFEGVNDANEPVKLSQYVGNGHYTLVDFWASWCGPCRREIPNVAKAYNTYKDKGLQVLGATVWDEMEAHLSAVKELNVTWPQIFNAKDAAVQATDLYGIAGIPQIILFGPDGKVVKRDLHGEEMLNVLAEILKNEGKF